MINALLKDNFSSMYEKDVALKQGIFFFFFSIWVFFHERSRFTGQQGKGEGIYLTPNFLRS